MAGVPADVSIDCSQASFIPAANVTVTDNCDPNVQVTVSETTDFGACQNEYFLTRTYTATDACGNTVSESQVIYVSDTDAPILIGAPSDVTIDLSTGATVPNPPNSIFATDNCDSNPDIDFNQNQVDEDCGFIITRTWIAIDECGNESQVTQTITVFENESLTIIPLDPEVCLGQGIVFGVDPAEPFYTYNWTASSGSFDDPNIANPIYTASQTGDITISVSINLGDGCTLETTLTVTNGTPVNGTVSNNAPCEGEQLQLTATGGTSYSWTGPNGWTATGPNPTIDNVDATHAGVYLSLIHI